MEAERAKRSKLGRFIDVLAVIFVLIVLAGVWLGQSDGGAYKNAAQSATMQRAHALGVCLYAYANDHNGHYPEGKTSTEVFQQLLDGGYVTSPKFFYAELGIPGKVPPVSNQLKAENVCWDVTCCVDSSAPDGVPVVFLTGFRITYQAGASAVPISPSQASNFMAVYYKNNNAMAKKVNDDGVIPDFIPADFDPKGKTYRQLTP